MNHKRRGAVPVSTVSVLEAPSASTHLESTHQGTEPEPSVQARKTVVAVEEAGPPYRPAPHRILTFTAPAAPRGSSQIIIGWVPGRGSDRSATATDTFEW